MNDKSVISHEHNTNSHRILRIHSNRYHNTHLNEFKDENIVSLFNAIRKVISIHFLDLGCYIRHVFDKQKRYESMRAVRATIAIVAITVC